ncbi:MAG: hypothetical protein AABX89_05390 [Candidatus Thermoplasmatota archaeon]
MRTLAQLAAVAALLLAPCVAAGIQDASTYPEGVSRVEHTAVRGGADFTVTAVDGSANKATLTVCRFKTLEQPTPDICYFNIDMPATASGFVASTSGGTRGAPPWKDGWAIGYKVTLAGSGSERHAPDRLTSEGDPDYYRLIVGQAEGSVEIEDDLGENNVASLSNAAPALPTPLLIGLLALMARRRA